MAIGVALIGSGIFARDEHFPAIQACPDLDLRAVYSRKAASTEKLTVGLANVDIYADDAGQGKTYADLLARSDIVAVIIALPILVQPEFIKQAIKAGKHVLSEKPIAKDIEAARELVGDVEGMNGGGEGEGKGKDKVNGATWSVGENFRLLVAYQYAAAKVPKLGRVLGFRTKVALMIQPGYKYLETDWRKNPGYEGGFLLDGGVHYIAAQRLLLGSEIQVTKVSAFTSSLQEHLPDVDTVHSIWQTSAGINGSFNASFGTSDLGVEMAVNCQEGSVVVQGAPRMVSVFYQGKLIEQRTFPEERSGIKGEVAAWAQGIVKGEPDARLSPAEAMKDLELLEAMLNSGKQGGGPVDVSS